MLNKSRSIESSQQLNSPHNYYVCSSMIKKLQSRVFNLDHDNTTGISSTKFFISRKHSSIRRVENYEEVRNHVLKHGFIEVAIEELSLNDQISIFKRSKYV